jgi:predicted  nucleic acid-binding Zn-ribbon protein
MSWRCSTCGETHEDVFRSCWRCGAKRPPSPAQDAEDEQEEREEAEEDSRALAEQEAQVALDVAVADYVRDAGWYSRAPEDHWVAAGNRLHRLVVAHRIYRQRQSRALTVQRPDLDRLWMRFFISVSLFGALVVSLFLSVAWLEVLVDNQVLFVVLFLGLLVASIATGHRVVERELRAAAEAAVKQGLSRSGGVT